MGKGNKGAGQEELINGMMGTLCYDDAKMELYMRDVGKRIQEERLKRNLSLLQLSHLSNVSLSHLNRVENGLRSIGIECLLKICSALSISVLDVLPLERVGHLRTNGERFDKITMNCSVKSINFLLDMAELLAQMEKKER